MLANYLKQTLLCKQTLLFTALLCLPACADDSDMEYPSDTQAEDTMSTSTMTDDMLDTSMDATQTGDDSTQNTESTETGSDTDTGFQFMNADPSEYVQVDRMGMPAINTAVITSKNAYNQGSPMSDAEGDFVPEIIANLTAIHNALDDDLTGLSLTPCAVDDCVGQAGPLVIPDTLKLNLGQPAGFPNGRALTDPVMDVTLAVVLLDLSVHTAVDLVGVNPTANDMPFLGSFPYLAAPHQ